MLTRYGLPALAVVAFSFAVLQMTRAQQKPPAVSPPVEPARSPYADTVAGAGLVEPESENIALGSHLPGLVKDVKVRVGQRVKAGDLLFELDDQQLTAELGVREAALVSSQAQLTKLKEMPRAEDVPPYQAKYDEAVATLNRNRELLRLADKSVRIGGTSEDVWITADAAVKVAATQVAQAKAELQRVLAGAWEQDKLVAAAAVTQARAMCDQTRTELRRLKVFAPVVRRPDAPAADGPVPPDHRVEFKVLQVNVRPGEPVGTAPGQALVMLGTVGRLHVRVDIDESDIPRYRLGIPGTASPRGDPGKKFPLRFVRVEPFVIPKKSLTGGNTERVDTRVLQVVYAIDAVDPGLYVGQQMDVSLNAAGR